MISTMKLFALLSLCLSLLGSSAFALHPASSRPMARTTALSMADTTMGPATIEREKNCQAYVRPRSPRPSLVGNHQDSIEGTQPGRWRGLGGSHLQRRDEHQGTRCAFSGPDHGNGRDDGLPNNDDGTSKRDCLCRHVLFRNRRDVQRRTPPTGDCLGYYSGRRRISMRRTLSDLIKSELQI